MKFLLIFVLSLVFPDLLKVIPVSIHVNVILFSTILVVLTMVGTAFFMYNAFGKPFETLHGPLGLYLLSFISGKDTIQLLFQRTSTLTQRHVLSKVSKDRATYMENYSTYTWMSTVALYMIVKVEKNVIIQQ